MSESHRPHPSQRRAHSLGVVALFAAALVTAFIAKSAEDELKWRYTVLAEGNKDAALVFTAEIPEGWILYSTDFSAALGPRAATFKFEANEGVELIGGIEAIRSSRKTDRTFGTEYSYFAERAEFRQRVRLTKTVQNDTDGEKQYLRGTINGQTCQEKDGLCALFKQPFQIELPQ